MARHPIRRAQIIRPFGVGASTTFPDGVSLMVAGLDHWYREPAAGKPVDVDEFVVEEWRLQKRLGVQHLRLPPDHRAGWIHRDARTNVDLTVPALRFPQMHACQRCDALHQISLTEGGRKRCPNCERDGKWGSLIQVQFLAMCGRGHVQDFPFREWVHRSTEPDCHLTLRLRGLSGASLISVFVHCDCGRKRTLAGVTDALNGEQTVLSHSLGAETPYLCKGRRPWLGGYHDEACGEPLRGGLRSASNTYFASTMSSVYVPREHLGVPPDVAASLDEPPVSTWIRTLRDVNVDPDAGMLRNRYPGLVPEGVDDRALDLLLRGDAPDPALDDEPDTEEEFRALEYQAISGPRDDPRLTVTQPAIEDYAVWVRTSVDRVCLIERLRVTTAFTGFTRIRSDDGPPARRELQQRANMLWVDPPDPQSRWLPASVVYGEGIFLRFDLESLQAWSRTAEAVERAAILNRTYARVTEKRETQPREIIPEFVAIHTLAHVFIEQLAFEAGYAAASLSERLYISRERSMAGLLIYTAAGDSEGTLGGLVRLGRPGLLEPILQHALERARWCSSDPVCSELGEAGGQGPDSCNLAACHDCALLPETACEEFNRFLDREVLVSAFPLPDVA